MCRTRSPRRRGSLTPHLLFLFMVMLALFGVAVNHARLWCLRAELQANADAASLAALEVLVDDDLLLGDPQNLPDLFQRARDQALQFSAFNPVNGQALTLNRNEANEPLDDIVLGRIDTPVSSKTFVAAEDVANTSNSMLAQVNSVRVTAKLTRSRGNAPLLIFAPFTGTDALGVGAVATAVLDRDVIGFRPATSQPLPLAPFALLSDSLAVDLKSWQYQVETTNGPDQYRYDRPTKAFVADAQGDGLREFQAVLATDGTQLSNANVALLYLGTNSVGDVITQLGTGVTAADLAGLGGKVALEGNNRLDVSGDALGPSNPSPDLDALHQTLENLRQKAEVRIWPLYSGFNGAKPSLSGFVAARVVVVDAIAANQPLTFRLQPTMISTPSALTNAAQRGINGVPLVNPYICKLRFVE